MIAEHIPACTTAWLEDAVMPIADPGQPTPQQLEDHRRLHLPYRQWCKWCVQGRGRGSPRTRTPASNIAVIGVDYFFITSGGVMKRDELEYGLDTAGEEQLSAARAQGNIVKSIDI